MNKPLPPSLPPAATGLPTHRKTGSQAASTDHVEPPLVSSRKLMNDSGVLLIEHEGVTYRLQATRLGKLILTK